MNNADKCSYNIVPMAADDRNVMIEFFKQYFFRSEPLAVSLKIWEDTESSRKLENYAFKVLDNGLTFKAVSSNGDLIGAIANDIICRDSKEHDNCNNEEFNQENNCVKFQKFMNLFQKVKEESDPFKKYSNVNRIMEITLVAVNDIYKGQGVCKALFNKTKELALENECTIIRVECSSYYSASAAQQLKFQCIYSLYYREYKNEKNEVIFKPLPPHQQYKVYVLHVENIKK